MNQLLFRTWLLMILGIIFIVSATAQIEKRIGNTIGGESVISSLGFSIRVFRNDYFNFTATSSTLYADRENSSENIPVFHAPPNKTIQKIGHKEIIEVDGERQGFILILFNDGEVYAWFPEYQETKFFGKIDVLQSGAWERILGDAVFALHTSGVYVSRDDGATWQTNMAGIQPGTFVKDFDQDTTGSILYLATSKGIYRQDTLPGAVWSKVTAFTGTSANRVFIDRKNRIVVAGSGTGLWKSIDNGNTWPSFNEGLVGLNATMHVFADDAFGHLYGANSTTRRVYRSLHGTQPWERIDSGLLSLSGTLPLINSLTADSVLTAGTSVGLFQSNDQGITWQKADSGMVAENFYGLVKMANGKILTSTSLGVYAQNAGDTNWTKAYPTHGYSGQVGLHADPSGVLYGVDDNLPHLSTRANPLVKSTDGGVSWALDTAGLNNITSGLFYIDETGTQHYANTALGSAVVCRVWKRMPPGEWELDTVGFPAVVNSTILSMGSDGNGNLYLSGNISGRKVMRRPIAGGAWVVDTAGMGTVSRFEQMITGKNGNIIGRLGSFIFHTSGSLWVRIPNPPQLTTALSNSMAMDSAGNMFVGYTSGGVGKGVYYTKDFGANWTFAGLDSIPVSQMIAYDDSVYVLTFRMGAYVLTAAAPPDPSVCLWLGTKSTDWHDADNWGCGGVPDSTTSVKIPTGTPFACEVINADAVARRAWIQPGAAISVKNGRKLDVQGTSETLNW